MARRVLSPRELIERKGVSHAREQMEKAKAHLLAKEIEYRNLADEAGINAVQVEAEFENALKNSQAGVPWTPAPKTVKVTVTEAPATVAGELVTGEPVAVTTPETIVAPVETVTA